MKDRCQFEEEYCMCGILGTGRYAVVYKCMHKQTQQYYAAKLITKQQSQMFSIDTEIQILKQFRHNKSIVRLFEVYQNSSEAVLILELVGGGELLDLLSEVNTTEYDIACVLKQVCTTLYCLHYKNIVHMDVKPENILLNNTTSIDYMRTIRLVDFGLARDLQHPPPADDNIGGTPAFLAPEILQYGGYRGVTCAVDMWCLGVTTYISLTGISPFQGEDDTETITNIVNCNYYTGEELFGDYTDDALDFISKLLVVSPVQRMTAAECLSHPWLSKKKQGKQGHVISRSLTDTKCLDGVMAQIKQSLEALPQDPGDNIKPSDVDSARTK